MPDLISNAIVDDAVAEALQLDLCFLSGAGQTRHVPFAFTPATITTRDAQLLEQVSPLLGRLTEALASNADLLQSLIAPLARGDGFFAELLSIHQELHSGSADLPRLPLLLQRSDFMLDVELGPRLVECNSIAAGMAPFGDRTQRLHHYLRGRWPGEFQRYSAATSSYMLPNPAADNLAAAIASAAHQLRDEYGDGGAPSLLMVVQENEDNIFDQRLLERALQALGVRTYRRTFRELHTQLTTGPNQRLLLQADAKIDVVYLRAGYQYQDYIATDLDARRCCDALRATRIFIERHRVAVNATVAQQLATSKRLQQYLASASADRLAEFGFSASEALQLRAILVEMRAVDAHTISCLRERGNTADWVLKNQGEGGGHCLFDEDIAPRIERMSAQDYPAWTLMRRLRPVAREIPTLVVREGRGQRVERLVSEIGMFTAHLAGRPLLESPGHVAGYVGYLVRSKPPHVTEGGVHSGFGMLDSLVISPGEARVMKMGTDHG
jgi:glutathione synthetase